MLIGEYIHTIDDKNRISLPVKFRKEMGKKIVVAPGFDNCLFILTLKEWEKMSEQLSTPSSFFLKDNRGLGRYILGGAHEIDVDSIGRILIPEFLQKRIGLSGKAALIGVKNRVEVWNEKVWGDYRMGVEKNADQLAEKLSGEGVL